MNDVRSSKTLFSFQGIATPNCHAENPQPCPRIKPTTI
jgi:hypothetical protein